MQHGSQLFFTTFYDGPLMLTLDDKKPGATVLWKGKSDSEIQTDGLHAVIATPVIIGDYIYGICSYGQFRCLKAKTGERIWETQAVTKERARWASGVIVRHGDRLFINNDRGELDHRQARSEGLPGDQPHAADQADLGAAEPAAAGLRELDAARVRQPAHLRAQRRGNHLRVAGATGE